MPADTPTAPLAAPNFRWLWFGQIALSLAVQSYAVAVVWLVLQATGSGSILGAVLTVAAVPRAATMLFSGALLDRASPRRVSVAASLFSALAIGIVSLLIFRDALSIWQVFVLAALLGLADAFFYPAALTLTVRLVSGAQLAPANAFMQGADSLANVLGPALAGALIASFGLGAALLVNTGFYLLGAVLFMQISERFLQKQAVPGATPRQPFGQAVLEGLHYAWRERPIRVSLIVIAMLNFAVLGPVLVGGAVMAEERFSGGAGLFGAMSALFGVGMLIGTAIAGLSNRTPNIGRLLVALGTAVGLCLLGLGFAPTPLVAFGLLAVMGISFGVTYIHAVTWLQRGAVASMQGRVASLLTFAAVATDPFSNALAGVLTDVSLKGLFLGAGGLMLLTALFTASNRDMRAPAPS